MVNKCLELRGGQEGKLEVLFLLTWSSFVFVGGALQYWEALLQNCRTQISPTKSEHTYKRFLFGEHCAARTAPQTLVPWLQPRHLCWPFVSPVSDHPTASAGPKHEFEHQSWATGAIILQARIGELHANNEY